MGPPGIAYAFEGGLRLQAIGLMCAALVCLAVLDTAAKYLAVAPLIPVLQIVWLRFVGHALFNLAALGPGAFFRALHSSRPAHQWLRGVLMLAVTGLNFTALKYLQLDETAAIFFITPSSWPRWLAPCLANGSAGGDSRLLFLALQGYCSSRVRAPAASIGRRYYPRERLCARRFSISPPAPWRGATRRR